MINKFFLTILISVFLSSCGFSPIYTGNSKQVIISIEIITCLEFPVYIGEKPQLDKKTDIKIVRKNLFIISDNIK